MEERKGFGSNFGFLMASVGSAVGLGNIWGFPNKMGASGGFTFLVVYLVLAVLCGFIVMVGELALGRKTGKGVVSAYHVLSKRFKWLGWLGILSPFFILFFYCALGGYCIKYVVVNVGDLFGASFGSAAFAEVAAANGTSLGAEVFNAFMGNPTEAIIYGLIFVALTMLIVMGGVSGGIEKVCSVGMPALFVMLLICIIRACTLPDAVNGLKYMFVPGWAVANGIIEEAPNFLTVLSTAGGQMFFSLSLGMGIMITYGSYLDKKENVFSRMGGLGPIFGILFYLLVVFAAISSSISLLEAVVAHFVDKARDSGKGDKRKKYTLIAAVAVGVGAILICADSLGGADFTPWKFLGLPEADIRTWNDCWLDFFDMLSEGIMMPLGALLMSIMIGWELGPDVVKEECEQSGHPMSGYGFFKVCIKFITPLCMILVLYGQIKEFFF